MIVVLVLPYRFLSFAPFSLLVPVLTLLVVVLKPALIPSHPLPLLLALVLTLLFSLPLALLAVLVLGHDPVRPMGL